MSGPIRFLKVFTIYGPGGHLGHVTCTIYINFLSHFPRRLTFNLAFIDQAVLKKKMLENNVYMHVYSPEAGAGDPPGVNVFINSTFQSI